MKSHKTANVTTFSLRCQRTSGSEIVLCWKTSFAFRILRELWSCTLPKSSLHVVLLTILDTLNIFNYFCFLTSVFPSPIPPSSSSFSFLPVLQRTSLLHLINIRLWCHFFLLNTAAGIICSSSKGGGQGQISRCHLETSLDHRMHIFLQ